MKLILASASPRRAALLSEAGINFTVSHADIDETELPDEAPEEMVRRLSLLKAKKVCERSVNSWVLGADTTVVFKDRILGKPKNRSDAHGMLKALQGNTHTVWTGFSLVNIQNQVVHIESHLSRVTFVSLSDADIESYIDTGEPMDKAGSYAIQGRGAGIVSRVEGSYTNVVGLPLSHVIDVLVKFGIISSRFDGSRSN